MTISTNINSSPNALSGQERAIIYNKFGDQLFFLKFVFLLSDSFFNSFRNTNRVSNCLDPDQAGHFVLPDLDQN